MMTPTMDHQTTNRFLKTHVFAITFCAIFIFTLGSCREQADKSPPTDKKLLHVFVSIPPQKYFVERIGGDHVSVSTLLKPGQSPHTYEPTPKQMVELSAARVYFRIGVPFEKQVVGKIASALEQLVVVDTSEGIALRVLQSPCEHDDEPEKHDTHTEHAADHHHHNHDDVLDTHTWMSPRLAGVHARHICETLSRLDPSHGTTYRQNLEAFQADLNKLDAQIAEALAPLKGREFYVFHPAFGYFADAYGLKQVAVELAGKQPTAKQIAALIASAKEAGVKLIFVQPQFTKRSAETVAEAIGGAVVVLDPLAEDYLDNLLHVANTIQKALGQIATNDTN